MAAGKCTVRAETPHKSSHAWKRKGTVVINGIGEVECTYDPVGALKLETVLQKKYNGVWYDLSTTLENLAGHSRLVRQSRNIKCEVGTFRMISRAYAAGPKGQSARWSLWAVGYTATFKNCDPPPGGGGSRGSW